MTQDENNQQQAGAEHAELEIYRKGLDVIEWLLNVQPRVNKTDLRRVIWAVRERAFKAAFPDIYEKLESMRHD